MLIKPQDIIRWLEIQSGAEIIEKTKAINGISINSKTIKQGDVFIAIKGENYDGSRFIDDAINKGASFAITGKNLKNEYKNRNVLIVEDTTDALQTLAREARKTSGVKFIGITGSAGKTTTKEMTFSLVENSFNTGKTWGNYNNLYGLPLCLANMRGDEKVYVGEMGMSYAGELKKLVEIADPDIAVLLNVHPVHTVNFGSLEKVAEAKAELFKFMRDDAIAVYNNDNNWSRKIGEERLGERITYGIINHSDVMAQNIRYEGFNGTRIDCVCDGDTEEIFIPRYGLGNIHNFLAAAAAAYAAGVEIGHFNRRINKMAVAVGRGNVYKLGKNVTLLDDSYNSNPVAMEMLLGFIERYKAEGRKIVVAGDMLELGKSAESEHYRIGKIIAKSDIDVLLAVGELSRNMIEGAIEEGMKKSSIQHFKNSKEAAKKISNMIEDGDLVLVKGSNGIKTNLVVDRIKEILQ